MNKITGTILEAGYHLDAAGTIPGVTIEANSDDELRGWDGPLYGRRVVVVDEKDYDAREAEEERLRDVKRQRVAEGMSRWCNPQSPHLAAIADALEHAKEAFMQGYYEHALDALAQCGAVVVRMMEVVEECIDEAAKAGREAK